MALEWVGEVVVRILVEVLFEWVCYLTGKMIIPIISLGHWHTISDPVHPKYQPSKCLGLFSVDGHKTVSVEGQSYIGLMFYGFVLLVCLVYYSLKH